MHGSHIDSVCSQGAIVTSVSKIEQSACEFQNSPQTKNDCNYKVPKLMIDFFFVLFIQGQIVIVIVNIMVVSLSGILA